MRLGAAVRQCDFRVRHGSKAQMRCPIASADRASLFRADAQSGAAARALTLRRDGARSTAAQSPMRMMSFIGGRAGVPSDAAVKEIFSMLRSEMRPSLQMKRFEPRSGIARAIGRSAFG